MDDFFQEVSKHDFCTKLSLNLPDYTASRAFNDPFDNDPFYWGTETEHMEMFRHERFPVFVEYLEMEEYSFYAGLSGEPPPERLWCAVAVSANGALGICVDDYSRSIYCTKMNDAFMQDILAAAQSFYGRPLCLSQIATTEGCELTLRFSDGQ